MVIKQGTDRVERRRWRWRLPDSRLAVTPVADAGSPPAPLVAAACERQTRINLSVLIDTGCFVKLVADVIQCGTWRRLPDAARPGGRRRGRRERRIRQRALVLHQSTFVAEDVRHRTSRARRAPAADTALYPQAAFLYANIIKQSKMF